MPSNAASGSASDPAGASFSNQVLKFVSKAVDEDSLQVVKLEGHEALNSPYQFVLDLASQDAELDFAKLLEETAYIAIKQGVQTKGDKKRSSKTLKIHGRLASFEQIGKDDLWIQYRAVLVPGLWMAGENKDSAIFQDMHAIEAIESICADYGLHVDTSKVTKKGPVREYIAQYQESDLDFINRWCEHEGIYYYFVQEDDYEEVVFADAREGYGLMQGENTFRYRPGEEDATHKEAATADGDDWFKEEYVTRVACRANRLPKEIILKDYNWKDPDADMVCKATVNDKSVGSVFEYNNHYADKSDGDRLAAVRADALKCREHVFTGSSDCRGFRAGLVFTLEDHYRGSFNQEYVLTRVTHTAKQAETWRVGGSTGTSYNNRFVCIPESQMFRPERVTPWPQIKGVMHGKVDGGDAGTPYSQLDDLGRYKVRLGFNNYDADADDGQASKYIRKSEPYAGPNQGMHFPLLRGSEVLVTHIDGDPDRPVISGAVFNSSNPTVVGNATPTLNRIATPASTQIVMDDTQDAMQILMETKDSKTKMQFDATTGEEKVTLESPNNMMTLDGKSGSERTTIESKKEGAVSIIRMGLANGETTPQDKKGDIADADGMRLSTEGDFNQKVMGNANIYILKELNEWVVGKKNTTVTDSSIEYKIGDWFSMKAAASVSIGVAASFEAKLAASVSITGGLDFSLKAAVSMTVDLGPRVSYAKGHKWEIGEDKYNQTVKKAYQVEGLDAYTMKSGKDFLVTSATKLHLEAGTGAVGALNTALAAHAQSMTDWKKSSGPGGSTPPPLPPAAAKTTPTESPSIKIESSGITLKVGSTELKIATSGITMKAGAGELKVEASGVTGKPQVKDG